MTTAVRYYSRSGNTKRVADAIAEGAGTKAISVDAAGAGIDGKVDVLFVGGAVYAYGIDKNLKAYLDTLSPEKVGKAVVFSTSWLTKHGLDLIAEALKSKGIPVEKETFYCKSKEVEGKLPTARKLGQKYA